MLKRFSEQSLAGLFDAPRSGAPTRYTPEVKAQIGAPALTPRDTWGSSSTVGHSSGWQPTSTRNGGEDEKDAPFRAFPGGRLALAARRNLVWAASEFRLRSKKRELERLRSESPAYSAILNIDEMGPVPAKGYPGRQAINVTVRPARQEIDDGWRGKRYVYCVVRDHGRGVDAILPVGAHPFSRKSMSTYRQESRHLRDSGSSQGAALQ